MNISEAIEEMRKGELVGRWGWEHMFISTVYTPDNYEYISVYSEDGIESLWECPVEDILADDWELK